MTEFEAKILERVAHLEAEIAALKTGNTLAAAVDYHPDDVLVGKDYVAERFNCTTTAVLRERAGTHLLRGKEKSFKPLMWAKRDVDAAFREFSRSPADRAAEARAKAKPRKPRSILTKQTA